MASKSLRHGWRRVDNLLDFRPDLRGEAWSVASFEKRLVHRGPASALLDARREPTA